MKARRLVKECKYPEEAEDRLLCDIIVTGVKSTRAYRKVIDEGKDITRNEDLDIYKNEASVSAHLQLTCLGSKIHRIQDNYHSSDEEREEETVYRLQDGKCKYNSQRRGDSWKKTRYSAQSGNSNMNCNNCGLNRHKTGNRCPAHGKECNNCGKIHHYARVVGQAPNLKTLELINLSVYGRVWITGQGHTRLANWDRRNPDTACSGHSQSANYTTTPKCHRVKSWLWSTLLHIKVWA